MRTVAEIMVPEIEAAFWADENNTSKLPEVARPQMGNVKRVFGVINKVTKYQASKELVPGITAGLVLAVTAILWRMNSTASGSHGLIYIYLFPVALIAALYSGRLALLGAAIALVCADYFLQEPIYSLANDNPLEYGDLFVFGILAVTTVKFIRVLVRPRTSLAAKSRSAQ